MIRVKMLFATCWLLKYEFNAMNEQWMLVCQFKLYLWLNVWMENILGNLLCIFEIFSSFKYIVESFFLVVWLPTVIPDILRPHHTDCMPVPVANDVSIVTSHLAAPCITWAAGAGPPAATAWSRRPSAAWPRDKPRHRTLLPSTTANNGTSRNLTAHGGLLCVEIA